MLNPESVDYNSGKVRLLFTDDEANEVLKVYLTEADAWRLHEMIQRTCNWPAKEKRSHKDEKFDQTF